MIIVGVKNNKIFKIQLPNNIEGNYLIKDNLGNTIGYIASENNNWVVYPNQDYQLIYNGNVLQKSIVEELSQFFIKNLIDGSITLLVASPTIETKTIEVKPKKSKITIGTAETNDICYKTELVSSTHATITHEKDRWYIECNKDSYIFVDDRLAKRKRLNHGDLIYLYGLKIVCLCDFIVLMNSVKTNQLILNPDSFEKRIAIPQEVKQESYSLQTEHEVFNSNEQFLRSPRFKTTVTHKKIKLTSPPDSQTQQIQPGILTIGPQLTMMLTSLIGMFTTLTNVANGNQTLSASLPTLILTSVTMVSALFWPSVTRKWNKRENKRKEIIRIRSYRNYLAKKEKDILNIISNQKQILLENNVTLEQCQQIIYQRKRNLWERTIEDEDFLTTRIGVGFIKPDIEIEYAEEDFSVKDDVLKDELNELVKKFDYVEEAPLNFSFLKNRISAIVGNFGILQLFFESMLLQIMTFHLYSELKIVVLTSENHAKDWDFVKFLPHCWDNSRTRRFIAATIDEKKNIASYLENVIKEREELINPQGKKDDKDNKQINEEAYKKFSCYYLIITDDISSCRHLDVINKILDMKENLGFSMIIKNDRITNLPNQCTTFMNINEETSGMFGNELNISEQKQFKADLNKTVNVEDCVEKIANIYVKVPKEKYELPKSIGFMEMYGIGNVEQFNSLDRWSSNNPVVSLSVPVGIDQNGDLFNMDIHEKAYGPHGLVAGTTGSGKSEWIITYILSLSVNFSPLEVQFVLIDYKGGGLAGSFENKETGIRLPHLIGTITNLDKSEIRRSLASLEAESKRRQRMFNEAREKLNDSSMNIYKYQQYYRKGMLDEPLSHLFLISDEFAELKSQEPEFLEQLVSIARIGRSLGIHLILATQKPAGVVDEQMWSNSRFKVCLRVQDKQDSVDMIKCADAAYLKQTGAFYFQVGLNEFFGLGQSAYAGAKYKPTSILKKKIDTSLDIVDRVGEIINTVDNIEQDNQSNPNVHGEELLNIIMYLSDIAKKQNITARKLWLDAIPENIYIDNLKTKYGFKRNPYYISPIIGEYDNPHLQLQKELKMNLNASNIYIAGISGSGKEKLLQAMIYSTITNYTPQEVSIYICDFGAETLGMFENAPQVGDIVYATDKVKLENLNRFIKKEIKDRRSKYREFGGSYESYINYSPEKDNLLVVVINDVGFIRDNYQEIFEDLESTLLESAKYGIIFVETANEPALHKTKILNTFEKYLLKFTQGDYESVFGTKARGINPKDLKGRGLTEIDGSIFEFQTASICDDERLQQSVKFVCQKLNEAYKTRAPKIPKIPKTINMDVLNKNIIDINNICVGYSVASIAPIYFNLEKNQATLILGSKKTQLRNYMKVMNQQLDIVASKGTKVYLFDPEDSYKMEFYKNITYVETAEIQNTINNLIIYINGEYEKYSSLENKQEYQAPSKSLIVFYCITQIYRLIGDNVSSLLVDIFAKARELNLFDFLVVDISNDIKEIQRHRTLLQMFIESNGVCIGNSVDTQMILEMNTRDIRIKDSLLDHEGYIIERGKGKLSQVLQFEGEEESDIE